jgi:ABC-type sugar transport system permease subunit
MMLSPAVIGLFWNLILDGNYGIVNQALGALGLPEPQWTTDRDCKFASILLIDVWMWTPFMLLSRWRRSNSIPGTLYEAAEVDRASAWTVFRRITLPCARRCSASRRSCADRRAEAVRPRDGGHRAERRAHADRLDAALPELFRDQHVGLGSAYACLALVIVIALARVFTRSLERLQRRAA